MLRAGDPATSGCCNGAICEAAEVCAYDLDAGGELPSECCECLGSGIEDLKMF